MSPMSAVTNQTIKELIFAANRFRAPGATAKPAAQPAKKYYTLTSHCPDSSPTRSACRPNQAEYSKPICVLNPMSRFSSKATC